MDVGQYNIRNNYNDYLSALTPDLNLRSTSVELYFNNSMSIDNHQSIPNSSISEIKIDYEYILESSMAPAPPAQVLLT